MQTTQDSISQKLTQISAECISWSTVEGISLTPFLVRLRATEQAAEQAGLSLENIRLALQVGEYQAQFGA